MPALGQKQTLDRLNTMSALSPKADIAERDRHVRFVPKADKVHRSQSVGYSIISSAVASNHKTAVHRPFHFYGRSAFLPGFIRPALPLPLVAPQDLEREAPARTRLPT
jgi:hypothetical protein